MWKDAYLESRVLSADPLELARMLYQCAIESAQTARLCLRSRDIVGRSKAICRAMDAIGELNASLDLAAGPVSANLAQLYHYMRQRLTQANLKQVEEPIAEVEALLTTLAEAYQQNRTQAEEVRNFALPQPSAWQDASASGVQSWSA